MPKLLDLGEDCPSEQRVPCLFLKYPSARFLIFYLHSNAEDLGKCYSFCHVLREQFQVHVLAVEYPGYGLCPGGPATADSVTENAFVVFRFVREVMQWPTDSIKIFGRSIGTGPAISLAVQYKVSGLILVAPFLSIKELVNDTVGVFSYLVEERFPSKDRMHLVRSPALIIHGQKDALIPYRHGTLLYELCRSRKLLVCPEGMEHNSNLLKDVGYLVAPMLQFFSLPDYCFKDIDVPGWAYNQGGLPPPKGVPTAAQGAPSPRPGGNEVRRVPAGVLGDPEELQRRQRSRQAAADLAERALAKLELVLPWEQPGAKPPSKDAEANGAEGAAPATCPAPPLPSTSAGHPLRPPSMVSEASSRSILV